MLSFQTNVTLNTMNTVTQKLIKKYSILYIGSNISVGDRKESRVSSSKTTKPIALEIRQNMGHRFRNWREVNWKWQLVLERWLKVCIVGLNAEMFESGRCHLAELRLDKLRRPYRGAHLLAKFSWLLEFSWSLTTWGNSSYDPPDWILTHTGFEPGYPVPTELDMENPQI